jgi:hypothetical protein
VAHVAHVRVDQQWRDPDTPEPGCCAPRSAAAGGPQVMKAWETKPVKKDKGVPCASRRCRAATNAARARCARPVEDRVAGRPPWNCQTSRARCVHNTPAYRGSGASHGVTCLTGATAGHSVSS